MEPCKHHWVVEPFVSRGWMTCQQCGQRRTVGFRRSRFECTGAGRKGPHIVMGKLVTIVSENPGYRHLCAACLKKV